MVDNRSRKRRMLKDEVVELAQATQQFNKRFSSRSGHAIKEKQLTVGQQGVVQVLGIELPQL